MHKPLFESFIKAPDSHIDPKLRAKIVEMQDLNGKDATEGLVDVLNMGVRYGLVSDLMVASLSTVSKILCNAHGLDFDTLNETAHKRIESKEQDDMM